MSHRISAAIDSLVNGDVDVFPAHRRRGGNYLLEVVGAVCVGNRVAHAVAVVDSHDVFVDALRYPLVIKQIYVLLDGRCLFLSVVVLNSKILPVGAFKLISASDMVLAVGRVVGWISHNHLSGAIHIARIRAARDGAEYVAVEYLDSRVAHHVALLASAVDEVGRDAQTFRIAVGVDHAARQKLVAVNFWLGAFHRFADCHVCDSVDVAFHTVSGTVNVECGIFGRLDQQLVRLLQFVLVLSSQHVALQVDEDVANDCSALEASAIHISADVCAVFLFRHELVADVEFDERIFRVGIAEQISAHVLGLAFVVVVGVVATAHNLVGYSQSFRECVFKHISDFSACLRQHVHITAVSAAAERADYAVGQPLSGLAAVPFERALYVGLHRLEVEVE